jgi:alkanesulfonate monooxygenase SsuD/methylene tetrahydromethanopterin reductase-like flavin-dependent oxidoreductase (luciferase family)
VALASRADRTSDRAVKVGITLPQFRDEADTALAAARRAEELGIDAVFCFDHLWPMGKPGRPALSSGPLLGALAGSTTSIGLGTLVARIGLLPDEVLIEVLCGVQALSGGRLIAGIGTGDKLSREENEAYGIPFEPAAIRRERLGSVATAVAEAGIPVWVGGGKPEMVDLARATGAAVNVWQVGVGPVADLATQGVEVTWGGPAGDTVEEATAMLGAVAAAGATWAVCAWPESLEVVAEAASTVR